MNSPVKNTIMLVIGITLLFIICGSNEPTEPLDHYGDVRITQIVRVVDGDTFRCTIKQLHPLIGKDIPVRIYGIDCPELRSKDPEEKARAEEARLFTRKQLLFAKTIWLREMRRGSFFRIVAKVFIDNKSLGQMLIEAGLAEEY